MSKRIYTDEEVAAMPSAPPSVGKKKRIYTDKEVAAMPSAPTQQEPTSLADDLAYMGRETLSAVGSGLETIDRYTGAPVRKAITTGIETGSPIEAIKAGAAQFGEPGAPTESETAAAIGFSEEPIGKIPGTDIEVSPADIAGVGVGFIDPTMLIPGTGALKKGAKAARAKFLSAADKQAFKSLARIARKGKAIEQEAPALLGRTLLENDLAKYLNKPTKLRQVISGSTDIAPALQDGVEIADLYSRNRSAGMLGKLSDELQIQIRAISEHPGAKKIAPLDIVSSIYDTRFGKMQDPISGKPIDDEGFRNFIDTVKSIVYKKDSPDFKPTLDVAEAQKLKQNIGKELNSDIFRAPPDRKFAIEKQALKDSYLALKDFIEKAVEGVPLQVGGETMDASNFLKAKNQKLSTLMKINDSLDGIDLSDAKKETVIEKILSTVISGTAGGMVAGATGQSVPIGVVVGAGLGGGREAIKSTVKASAPTAARATYKAAGVVEPVASAVEAAIPAVPAARMATRDEGRSPDSIAELVIDTPLPRDFDRLMEMKEVVKAKIAQVAPDMLGAISNALERPTQLQQILPAVVQQFPGLFEPDPYNRVNGKVVDPASKAQALQDISNDEQLNVYQKALISSRLNKTGELIGY